VQLTSREWEVLELLGESYPTAEIARRLAVSPVTVRSHVASVVRKLGVADRDAARRVIAHAAGFERRRTRREPRSGLEPVHGPTQAAGLTTPPLLGAPKLGAPSEPSAR
jgi:DNA-binding CsgD family transcriptional regulator